MASLSTEVEEILKYLRRVTVVEQHAPSTNDTLIGSDSSDNLEENLSIFVLMGQSNMSGRGTPETIDKTPHPRVKRWKDGKLDAAVESIHGFDGRGEGVGPGLAFGKCIAENLTNHTIILIPTAVGSTSIAKWGPGKDLYNNAVMQTKQCLEKYPSAKIAGVLWAQGSSDSGSSKNAKKYGKKLAELIEAFNSEFGLTKPWIAAELSSELKNCTILKTTHWEKINLALQSCELVTTISAEGLTFIDTLHYDSPSQRIFGKRFAEAYLARG